MEEKNRRQQFSDSLKVEDFINDRYEQGRNQQERYKAKKASRIKAQKRKAQIIKKLEIAALVGVIGFGSLTAYNSYKEKNQRITIEQAIDNGKAPEEFGIKTETVQQLINIKAQLENEEINNVDLINIAPQINGLQFDVVKSKLAETLGLTEEQITLDIKTENGEKEESVKTPDGIYKNNSILRNSNTISKGIAKSIDEIQNMKDYMVEIQNGNFNRDEAIKKYKSVLNNIDKFSASKMSTDEKGNITVKYTHKNELEAVKEEQQEREP